MGKRRYRPALGMAQNLFIVSSELQVLLQAPSMVLSAMIHAGCIGIQKKLATPSSILNHNILKKIPEGVSKLPQTHHESLETLKNDAELLQCFPDKLIETYQFNKSFELKIAEQCKSAEIFKLYSRCY